MKHFILVFFLASSCIMFSQKTKKHGPFEDFYKSGELKTSGQYREGKKIGKWQDYYKSGELSKIYTYNNNGKKTGLQERYYRSGSLISKISKLKSGNFIEKGFYEEGELFYEMILSQKPKSSFLTKNGFYREFFKNKKVKIETNYNDNRLTGKWFRYYNSGEKEWEVDYYSDYKQGGYKKYFKNGQIEIEGNTALGFKHGIEKRYNEDGLVVLEGTYNKGKLNGIWTVSDENGNITATIKYKDGVRKKSKSDVQIVSVKIPDGTFESVPVYPGCELFPSNLAKKKCMSKKISEFVNKNFNTDVGDNLGLEGRQRIFVIFKINKEGLVTDIRARAPHKNLENEAIDVIKRIPKMKPGMQRGKTVNVPYSLPIVFMVKGKKKDGLDDPFFKKTRN